MAAPVRSGTHPLSVERIVDAACLIIEHDGLRKLSMRNLGAHLQVDPMAVYHHVAGKRELLALVTARTVGELTAPDPSASWDVRVRQWALGYWDLVVAHRELTLAGLADPEIAAGGLPATEPLLAAIAESGLAADLVEPNAYIVVDAVHGSALSIASPARHGTDDTAALRTAFEIGLETILAGLTARTHSSTS